MSTADSHFTRECKEPGSSKNRKAGPPAPNELEIFVECCQIRAAWAPEDERIRSRWSHRPARVPTLRESEILDMVRSELEPVGNELDDWIPDRRYHHWSLQGLQPLEEAPE